MTDTAGEPIETGKLAQIERAKQEWEATADSLPQLICLLDEAGGIVRVNRTVERWDLAKVNVVNGQTIHELLHPACDNPDCDLALMWAQAWQQVAGGQAAEFEVDDPLLNRYLQIQVRPISAETSRRDKVAASHAVIVIDDITARKQIERALQKAHQELEQRVEERTAALTATNKKLQAEIRQRQRTEATLQQTLDTVSDGILLLDTEHRIKVANPAAQKFLDQIARVGVDQVLIQLGEQPLPDLLDRQPASQWQQVSLPGSASMIFETMVQPIKAKSDLQGWVMVLRDVTQEREIEAQIRQQERLAAVGQLAAGIAHDFNNILTGIMGSAELVQADPNISSFVGQSMALIVRQSEQAARLIRQILDFSRHSLITRQHLDLELFLDDTVRLLTRTIPERIHITLDIEPHQAGYVIEADPPRIQQALTNLAVNARDAMPQGGRLRFRMARLSLTELEPRPGPDLAPGDWIVLSVVDTGMGIPPDIRPHIFDPFFTTKKVGQGTGLGMAQVYGIVKQHQGEIVVDSQPGQGTTFNLYFPAVSATAPPPEPVAETLPYGQGQVILLVEDEPMVLEVTQGMLEMLAYQVLSAADGQQALELYQQAEDEIDLVLTDMAMPGMDGVALSQALLAKNPALKILMVSGHPIEAEAEALLARGEIDWLQKPLNLRQLARAINVLLEV
jgi:two-component system cell cycle sensor histidine kinase/response regulator CckA